MTHQNKPKMKSSVMKMTAAKKHEDEIIDIDPASEYENVIGDNDD